MSTRESIVGETRPCGQGADGGEFGVTTVTSDLGLHRREPCAQCPWRMDVPTGVFPAQAFRESAHTAYDAAMETFACHMSGKDKPATCAGFLLRHSVNNLQVRMRTWLDKPIGAISCKVPIYPTYREMAIANGVEPDDPVLRPIRGDAE